MSLYRSTGIHVQDLAYEHTLNFDHSENRTFIGTKLLFLYHNASLFFPLQYLDHKG